jgi:hypothetical protein
MKRYSLPITVEYNGIEEDQEGEWVRYEDVKNEFDKYRIEHSICEDMVEELQYFLQGRRKRYESQPL